MAAAPKFRIRLEAKVMAAVVAVLVALPAVTLWQVDRQVTRQIQVDASLAAVTARESFVDMLKVRSDELALRFRNIAETNAGFLRILRLGDAATMRDSLRHDVLEQFHDTDLVAFITRTGEVWGVRRETAVVTPEAFASACDPLIGAAAGGEERGGFVAINGGVYRVIALPVVPPEGLMGVLVFGIHITPEVLRQVQPPSCHIIVSAAGAVAATTFNQAGGAGGVLADLLAPALAPSDQPLGFVSVGGERFQPVVGDLNAGAGIRYVLLCSSEQRLRELERTKLNVLGFSVAGILVCAGVVWFFVRRITRPLTELRQIAEAVGGGDFTQRIGHVSNDECGDLATAFNTMTANLQSSRAELEVAMQQVKTTQDQLIQSEKLSAVGQFVAGVAHELNNPLTAVVGFSELVQSLEPDPKIRDFLDKIAKSAHRCHKIVQSLLGFARQHAPERRLVELAKLVDEVLEIMAYDLRTSNITIVRDFAADLPRVLGDAHQLQQVFINLVANARQAIEPVRREGQIIIRTRLSGGRVQIQFEDDGPGIRPENLKKIFDPFFTTKPVGKGTGLGLSLCYGIIQEHGGTISVASEYGRGATFTIDLPTAPSDAVETPGTEPGGSRSPFPAKVASGKTVLVIDDEAWILELASELLKAEGHTVVTASGGEDALKLISKRNFDVIVSDWKMPGLNGIRLYEHLQATAPETARRVLFMTGDVVNDNLQVFLRERGLTCMAKPFATREFRSAVAKMFAAR